MKKLLLVLLISLSFGAVLLRCDDSGDDSNGAASLLLLSSSAPYGECYIAAGNSCWKGNGLTPSVCSSAGGSVRSKGWCTANGYTNCVTSSIGGISASVCTTPIP